jgi:hypothetical protein
MKPIGILILSLTLGAGCLRNGKQFDASRHTFVDASGGTANAVVLTQAQASSLVTLVCTASPDKVDAAVRADPNLPRPQLAPSLCVNVYADVKRSKRLWQILGYDRKWIVMGDRVISDTNTVDAVYRVLGK